jgi:hypothetical protein
MTLTLIPGTVQDPDREHEALREACELVIAGFTAAASIGGLSLEDRAFMLRARGRFARIGQTGGSLSETLDRGDA